MNANSPADRHVVDSEASNARSYALSCFSIRSFAPERLRQLREDLLVMLVRPGTVCKEAQAQPCTKCTYWYRSRTLRGVQRQKIAPDLHHRPRGAADARPLVPSLFAVRCAGLWTGLKAYIAQASKQAIFRSMEQSSALKEIAGGDSRLAC